MRDDDDLHPRTLCVHSVARTVLDLFLANPALKLEVTALLRTSKRSHHLGLQIIGQAKSCLSRFGA